MLEKFCEDFLDKLAAQIASLCMEVTTSVTTFARRVLFTLLSESVGKELHKSRSSKH